MGRQEIRPKNGLIYICNQKRPGAGPKSNVNSKGGPTMGGDVAFVSSSDDRKRG